MVRVAAAIAAIVLSIGFHGVASAACVSRAVPEAKGPRPEVIVVVPENMVKTWQAKGFTPIACPSADPKLMLAIRDGMCAAANGNEMVQARLQEVLGARPDEMCKSAERVLGPSPAKSIARQQADTAPADGGMPAFANEPAPKR